MDYLVIKTLVDSWYKIAVEQGSLPADGRTPYLMPLVCRLPNGDIEVTLMAFRDILSTIEHGDIGGRPPDKGLPYSTLNLTEVHG